MNKDDDIQWTPRTPSKHDQYMDSQWSGFGKGGYKIPALDFTKIINVIMLYNARFSLLCGFMFILLLVGSSV